MTTLYVYNNQAGRFETVKDPYAGLPFIRHSRLTMRDLLGHWKPEIAWTDRRALEAYDACCALWRETIPVNSAFRPLCVCRTAYPSAHYAGCAFDMGKGFPASKRERLRLACINDGEWDYVEPTHTAPTWVHAEIRPDCGKGPRNLFPRLRIGDKGVYVFLLQEALTLLNASIEAASGCFTANTKISLIRFQKEQGLKQSGETDPHSWAALFYRSCAINGTL